MNWRNQNKRRFYKQEAHIDEHVNEKFIVNNTAVIPCRVTDYYDIIYPFSVEGYETVSPEFMGYITDMLRFIPAEYPVILDIKGCSFTDEQKERISLTLKTDALYELGAIEKEGKITKNKLIYMLCGLLGMGALLSVMNLVITGMPREFLYIIFWFFADFIISYVLWDHREYRNELIQAGRLASLEVRFSN